MDEPVITEYFVPDERSPRTGSLSAKFRARLSNAAHLNGFFNGDEGHEQIRNVTRGKIYDVVIVNAYGDVADFTFTNDIDEPMTLGSFMFEKP